MRPNDKLIDIQHEFRVRRIRKSDNSAVKALIKKVLKEYGCIEVSEVDTELENIYCAYSQNNCAYFVIERQSDNKIIGGAGAYCIVENSICELKKMYLLPEGRGIGLGEVLLERVLSFAKEKGYKQCYLEMPQGKNKSNSKQSAYIWLEKPLDNANNFKRLQ